MTAKQKKLRKSGVDNDDLIEFYSGDATALGDNESVGYLIKLANQVVMRNLDTELQPYDLTAPQWVPLLVISKGRADTVAGCAREIGVDTGAMTRMLDRLETKGFVTRTRSAEDRRVVNVTLTKAGHEIVKLIPPTICHVLNRHLRGFSETEFETFKDLLRRFLANGEQSSQE
jgi:DNA-binding MarR family transcriptional regulator|tara:strand:+ start:5173 stop:5691 length:519 start_codon:yes stop_codon:yes gene_type:complete